jgi:predicted transcriptional regulator
MKKPLPTLGEREIEALQHVWKLKEATVKQVHHLILEDREVAYTTIMTLMKNLADKGYLKYHREGVQYVYSPAIEPESVRFNLVKDFVKKVFRGSSKQLVQTLVQNEEISDEERKEIQQLIDEMEE